MIILVVFGVAFVGFLAAGFVWVIWDVFLRRR